jgi:hypothetical protein
MARNITDDDITAILAALQASRPFENKIDHAITQNNAAVGDLMKAEDEAALDARLGVVVQAVVAGVVAAFHADTGDPSVYQQLLNTSFAGAREALRTWPVHHDGPPPGTPTA